MAKPKDDLLVKLLDELRKKYGKDSIVRASEVPPVSRLTTGVPQLDEILLGGWPQGRIVELWGPNNAGKTTLMLMAAAAAQLANPKRGEDCVVWCDQENTFDPKWAKVLGVDMDRMTYVKPMAGDDLADLLIQYIRAQVPLIAIDSIIEMVPESALVKSSTAHTYSPVASLLADWLPKVAILQGRSPTVLLVANQVRDKIGFYFGDTEKPSGGRALEHFKTLWIRVQRRGWIKDGDKKVGYSMALKVLKSKVSRELEETRVQVRFGRGIVLGDQLEEEEEKPDES